MSDPSATRPPADPADAVLDGLQPGQPLAEAVERHLNETDGPVPVDEVALQAAVRSATSRIASAAPGARSGPGSLRRYAPLLAAAALLLLAFAGAWSQLGRDGREATGPTFELGPGIALVDAQVREDGTTIELLSGQLSFHREGPVLPRFDRVRLPGLDAELVPVGTTFVVERTALEARVHVSHGLVELLRPDRVLGTVRPGLDGARLSAASVRGGDFVPVSEAVASVAPSTPAQDPGRAAPTDRDPGAVVAVNPDTVLPAVLVLFGAEQTAQRPAQVAVAVEAAELVGSTRLLVGIAPRLDAQVVPADREALVWFATGRARQAEGALDDALIAYSRVPAGHWLTGGARLRAAGILSQLGEVDGARIQLIKAISAGGPTERAARLGIARVHLATGSHDDALAAARLSGVRWAPADLLRVTRGELSEPEVRAHWEAELAVIRALLDAPYPHRLATGPEAASTPAIRNRLAIEPDLIELGAEQRALEAVQGTLSTTLDPAASAAWERAADAHQQAADDATRRALATLTEEIRTALR